MVDQQNADKTKTGGVSINEKPKASPTMTKLNRSQEQTSLPTLKLLAYVSEADELSSNSMEFHMTISTRITSMSPKQASMLLSVCCFRAVHIGIDFTLYLAMEFLYNTLWKSGHDPLETQSDKIRKTLLLSDVILGSVRGDWTTMNEYEKLPDEVIDKILTLEWLPSDRTFNSWRKHWDLEKYLKVKIVPVESLLNRNKYSTAERYSGYTRGYGNDGSPASPGKTKPSAELDGDYSEKPPPQLSLQEFEEYQTVIQLIEYSRARRRQNK